MKRKERKVEADETPLGTLMSKSIELTDREAVYKYGTSIDDMRPCFLHLLLVFPRDNPSRSGQV